MGSTLKQFVRAALAGGAAGCMTAFVLAVAYAVADLYLSGHGIKPSWFDSMANTLLPVAVGAVAITTAIIVWRVNSRR